VPQLKFHLEVLLARHQHARVLYAAKSLRKDYNDISSWPSAMQGYISQFSVSFSEYLSKLKGPPHEQLMQTYDEVARAIFRLVCSYRQQKHVAIVKFFEHDFSVFNALDLARAQRFDSMNEIIHQGSEEHCNHIGPAHVSKVEPLDGHCWLGLNPLPIRQVISTNGSHVGVTSVTPDRTPVLCSGTQIYRWCGIPLEQNTCCEILCQGFLGSWCFD
jgi:hypothetical protein